MGMPSLRELYRIGTRPSSSHTMAPRRAARLFREQTADAKSYRVTLFGSLAATGKGHITDLVINEALSPYPVQIIWRPDIIPSFHPNGMEFEALDAGGELINRWRCYSPGGGAIAEEGEVETRCEIYPHANIHSVLQWAEATSLPLWHYVEENESCEIWTHLAVVWRVMQDAIKHGVECDQILPGGLRLARKARSTMLKAKSMKDARTGYISAYALACAEENASGGVIATAPTCGSCGVLPAVLQYLRLREECADRELIRALAVAGLFGNVTKVNASISGAEVGCQGEIGTACAMAAAAAAYLLGGTLPQIEYAAEMGLEHHLGLTCDPVLGLVQIPCIERNAFAATRALDCAEYALLSDGRHRISFDQVVETMRNTGKDIANSYRETSTGGLAKVYADEADL